MIQVKLSMPEILVLIRVLNVFQKGCEYGELKNQSRQITGRLSVILDKELDKLKRFTQGDEMIGIGCED